LHSNKPTNNVMSQKTCNKLFVIESLKDIYSLLNNEERRQLAANYTTQRYKKNENIYEEGDVPESLMCLISGKVKVLKKGISGRTQIIRVIKAVDYFCYRDYFADQNFVTSAAAFEPSLICRIPMKLVDKWVHENTNLAMFFIKKLSIKLGTADERTVNLTQKHVRGRLAEALLFLKESYGMEEDGATLSIYLSREDLANLSNMTTSNAIRTLAAFAKEKILVVDGRKIKFINENELKKISQEGQ